MENNTNSKNIFAKYPALKPIAGVALIAVLFLGVQSIRGRLSNQYSDASCYGYQCQPSVSIGGRVVTKGYNNGEFSYGTLNVKRGSTIELTWFGANVDSCSADWSKFTGTYMGPTVFGAITANQDFTVNCFTNGSSKKGVRANLSVHIVK